MSTNQLDCRTNGSGDDISSAPPTNHCASTESIQNALHVNPFVHYPLQFTNVDRIKNAIVLCTLFPFKALLAVTSVLVAGFLAFLSLLGHADEDNKHPLPGWRNWLRPLVVLFSRGLFFFGGFNWVSVKGERVSPKIAPILVMAPHSSYFDALAVTYLNLTTVVAKTSAIKVPVFGTLTKFTEPVLVDREDPNSRQNTIKEIRRRAESGGSWPQVGIFPEGTCTNRTGLISFKPGAFIPGVPVQPVCIKYPNKYDTVTWTWCGIPVLKTLFYTVLQLNTRCEIEFLPVYYPSEEEKKDAKLFARNVREKMAEALGVPTTEHSYEDGEILCRISNLGIPCAKHLVNVHMLTRLSGKKMETNFLDGLVDTLHRSKSVFFNESEFVESLSSFYPADTCHLLFVLYSKHVQPSGSDVVDMRSVVVDLYLLTRPASALDILAFAFRVYDAENRCSLTRADVRDLLMTVCQGSSPSRDSDSFSFDDVRDLVMASISPEFQKVFGRSLQQPRQQPVGPDSSNHTNHLPANGVGDGIHQLRRAKAD